MRGVRFWLTGIVSFVTTLLGEGLLRKFLAASLCGTLAFNSGFCTSPFLDYSRANATQNLSSDKVNAKEIVAKFRQNTKPSKWNVDQTKDRENVANRLNQLIDTPALLDQGFLNLCGPAAFFYLWFKNDPISATRFVTELYENGQSKIGSLNIDPGKLKEIDFHSLYYVEQDPKKKLEDKMYLADWMMLSGLRNSENRVFLPYKGNPEAYLEEIGGSTDIDTIKKWLQAANLYDSVEVTRDNIVDKKNLTPDSEDQDVIMISIYSQLLSDKFSMIDRHVIVLNSQINTEGNKVSFKFWTWGKEYEKSFDKEAFKTNYIKAIIIKKKCKSESSQNREECKLKTATSTGDPHLATFDGLKYDLQTVGEVILVKSNDGAFEVQARQAPFSSSLSANNAVAIKVGRDRVAFYAKELPDADTSTPLRVNGKPTTIKGDKLVLQGGGEILKQGDTYVINSSRGEKLLVSPANAGNTAFFNVSPFVYNRSGKYSGLLGNVNGNPNDDLQIRGGSNVLEVRSTYGDVNKVLNLVGLRTPGVLDRAEQVYFDQLYKQFANSWRVKQEESLFDYPPGKTTKNYVNPGFPDKYLTLNMLSADQIQKARNACTEAKVTQNLMEGCIFDVGFSGFSEFARTAAEINGYISMVNQLFPGLNIPTPEQAINRTIERVKPKVCLPFVGCS